MSILPIRIVGDPVLHRPTTPVAEFADELHALVRDMFDTMDAANGVGLAANQVGVSLRLFVYDCPDPEPDEDATEPPVRRRGVVVNPVLETSTVPEIMPDPEETEEGCLSVPGEAFPLGRADWAQVSGTDADGNPVTLAGTGFLARCLQHEVAHLDGRTYLDALIGRHARAGRKAVKRHGWGVPGLSWTPGVGPDPFGH